MKWMKIENDVNDCTMRRACGKTKQYIRKLWFNKSVRNSLGDEQKNDGIYEGLAETGTDREYSGRLIDFKSR